MPLYSHQDGSRLRLLLLGAGAIVGLLLAASQLVGRTRIESLELPDGAVARVGSEFIMLERYRAVLEDLNADRRSAGGMNNRDLAIQRLIDEELLVQQGVRMGLLESFPDLRKALVSAVIAQTIAEAEALKPGEEQLRDLFHSDTAFFASAARYRVVWLRGRMGAPVDAANASEALTLLQSGASPERIAAATGLERVEDLPDALLPLPKLRDYVGSELADAVSRLEIGAAVGPLLADDRVHFVHLADYLPPAVPSFEDVRPLVEAEFTRRQGDAALRSQLEALRRESEIVIDPNKLAWP